MYIKHIGALCLRLRINRCLFIVWPTVSKDKKQSESMRLKVSLLVYVTGERNWVFGLIMQILSWQSFESSGGLSREWRHVGETRFEKISSFFSLLYLEKEKKKQGASNDNVELVLQSSSNATRIRVIWSKLWIAFLFIMIKTDKGHMSKLLNLSKNS